MMFREAGLWTPLALVLAVALGACGDKDADPDDGDGGGEETGVTGTDIDGDGYGSIETGGQDCDDGNAAVNPGAEERCDDRDNDCDGEIDEGFDADGDGFEDAAACADGTDCDDNNADANPSAEEIPYDGVDQDCDEADLTDVDGDGHDALEAGGDDCDDTDASISPSADEVPSDGIDQDCSGEDLRDGDGDGYEGVGVGGEDCDDTDASVYPGAEEIPYDGIDQDCVDGDLADLDEDGFDAIEAGGDDCDDTDEDIHPDAEETAYDGVDQDCSGADLTDVDGDGYDAEAAGGTDCDDRDADVHPGALDVGGDRVDSDCDGADSGAPVSLDDVTPSIWGESGSQDYMGLALGVCDLDDDGLDDLIVAAPLSDGYRGQLGIFFGASASGWSEGMGMSDADVVLTSTSYFLGFAVLCEDFDGDGILDLATTRGEINYTTTYTTEFDIVVWFGDGTGFSADLDDSDADAVFRFDLGAEAGGSSLYTRNVAAGDIDGDDAAEIFINMDEGANIDGSAQNGDDTVWILPGGSWSGVYDLDDEVSVKIAYDDGAIVQEMAVVKDMSGDENDELFLGQAGFDADPGGSTTTYEGLGAFISDPSGTTSTASELAFASLVGEADDALAFGASFADLDGDGNLDGLLNAYYDDTAVTYGGGLYLYENLPSLLTDTELGRADTATGHVYGEDAYTFFGVNSWPVGDLDGDGYVEVLAGQYAYTEAGRFYLLDGQSLFDEGSVSDAAWAIWEGGATTDAAGQIAGTGDFDGDGSPDLVLSAPNYLTTSGTTSFYSGRVYIVLGADAGW